MAFNSSRHYLRAVNADFARDVKPGEYVLDAGAGMQPYADLFDHAHYESADFAKVDKTYADQTYICDLMDIPVADGRFDHVVFNQVLEHLPDPIGVLKELRRVLKPGGRIICTCPLTYEEHEKPYDFYRYTQFAHRMMFEKAGFEIASLDWLEGYYGTASYQLRGIARHLPLWPTDGTLLAKCAAVPVVFMTRVAALIASPALARLDLAAKVTDRGYPKNYVVIARAKPTPDLAAAQQSD